MNWKFLLFLIALGLITFAGGYQYQILNYHHNDVSTWGMRVAVIVLCLFGIFISLIRFFSSRKGLPVAVTLFVILLFWIGALYAGTKINNNRSVATKLGADEIIRASYNYYTDHNKFPERLKDLQPKYLKVIPMVTLGTSPSSYEFYSSKEHFSITYDDLNSKGRRYDSDKKIWEELDRSFE